MKFFTATSELKELQLLQHIEKDYSCTQKEIADVLGAAVSMVNVYINDLEEKNYLKREYKSSKIVHYIITPKGLKRKNYLLISYMGELIDLYQLAKNNVEKFLLDIERKGYKNILLYGAGEVAETIIGVIRDREKSTLNVLAIIDDDLLKQGTEMEMLGYKVISRKSIKDYRHDGVVITSYTFEDEIRSRLEEVGYPGDKVVRFFSE